MVTVKVRVRDSVAAQTVEDTAFCKCGLLFASPSRSEAEAPEGPTPHNPLLQKFIVNYSEGIIF
jgi:hypothetical protein